jgi:hypothetical protein
MQRILRPECQNESCWPRPVFLSEAIKLRMLSMASERLKTFTAARYRHTGRGKRITVHRTSGDVCAWHSERIVWVNAGQ